MDNILNDIGGFKGGMAPELGPNKFRERPSGASRMQENLCEAGAPPQTPLGSLHRSPCPLAGGEEADCPLPNNPVLWVSSFGPVGLAPNPK